MDELNLLDDIIDTEQADLPVSEKHPIEISDEAKQNEKELEKIASVQDDNALKTKSASKKWLLALLFIAVNLIAILLTAVIEFVGEEHPVNISEVWDTFMENWGWGLGAIILVATAILCESTKRFILLKTTLKKNMPIISLNAAIITKYYDNITPLGAGGQPFEIYYLRKKGLPIGIASSVPIVSYSINKISYVFISLLFIAIYGFGTVSTLIKVLCLIGLFVNAVIPIAIIMFAFMPKFSTSVAHFIVHIGKKIRLVKNEEEFLKKITGSFIEYGECINYFLKKSKISILLSFICSIGYYLAMYSLPYFTVRMSGNHSIGWGQFFTYCVICYASITLLPTPGSSGGAELSFRSIFESYLTGGILFWSMLSWRIFSYYSFIVLGLILIIAQQVKKLAKGEIKEKKTQKKIEPEDELEPYSPIPSTIPTAEDDINTAEHVTAAETIAVPDVEVDMTEEISSTPEDFESVVEFSAVIESKSTVTITEEHVTENRNVENEPHQITLDEIVGESNLTEDVKSSEEIETEALPDEQEEHSTDEDSDE